jgi:hypothetical protein
MVSLYHVVAVVILAVVAGSLFRPERTARSQLHQECYGGDQRMIEVLLVQAAAEDAALQLNATITTTTTTAVVELPANSRDQYGNTPAHWAAKGGHHEVLHLLRRYGGDISLGNSVGSTPLHWAATQSNVEVLRAVFTAESDKKKKKKSKKTKKEVSNIEVSAPLLHNVNGVNQDGETALHWAVDWVQPAAVKFLLTQGASITTPDQHQNTPLHRVKKDCHDDDACVEIVQLLVAEGADVAVTNRFGRTALAHFDMGKASGQQSGGGTGTESDIQAKYREKREEVQRAE